MESLKKLWNNKMMRTFILVIIGIIILIIIAVMFIGKGSKNVTETSLVNAAKRYETNTANVLPLNEYDSRIISLSQLISSGYLESDDEGASCSSYVVVVKIGNDYEYTPHIKCNNESDSKLLSNKILSNVTSSGSGLYRHNDTYIYRGDNPNNYVLLGGKKWRIVGFDNLNNIRIVYSDTAPDYQEWDDRYNIDVDKDDGINEYNLSRIKDYLDNYLNTYGEGNDNDEIIFTSKVKSKLAKSTICIGKIDLDSNNIDTCSSKLDNVTASVITATDYMNASLDTLCSTSNTKNCQNYNFLNRTGWTISAYSGDTVKTYFIDESNGLRLASSYIRKAIRPVVVLRSDTIYVSGNGTETDPYVIK